METVPNPGSNRRDGFKNVRVQMLQKEHIRERQKCKHWIRSFGEYSACVHACSDTAVVSNSLPPHGL